MAGFYVDDQQVWDLGTVNLTCLLADLSGGTMVELTPLLVRYRKAKETLAAIVAEIDAADVCRECAGQCCQNGKYRINLLDILARIAAQIPTSTDFFQKPLCPYGCDTGCTMEPGMRPADCVLFVCDAIYRKLSQQSRLDLAAEEQVLRECIHAASRLTGEPMGTPLLIWAEKGDKSN